jgi:MFS superfamily sulfate permease-like transporter
VPFIVTIVGLVFTDWLTGIMLGMAVAFFEILIFNYQLNFYREQTSAGSFTIRLTEHMTFLNKASLKRLFRKIPPGCAVAIDMSSTRILDHDVREVIQDFATHAEADGFDLTVLGATGPKIALTNAV